MSAWTAPPLPARASATAKPAFVGRAAETTVAERAWAAVCSGSREVVFIGGEPGAGKSRLAEELGAAMHRRGAAVLMGICSPEGARSYQPFTECLEQLLGGTPEGSLAGCMPETARELLRLSPLVLRHEPNLQPPPDDNSDHRRVLFDAITSLLRAASRERAVVCVLEDLHWATAPTLQLLAHIVQHLTDSRLLLLCTHRTTAPDGTDDLTFAIADLYRLDGVRRLDLPGLSTDEVAQYLVAEGGLAVRRAREYAPVLRDMTGGNPFFLREVWRDVASRVDGLSARGLGTRPPASIRDTLQRRLSGLTPGEREVLELAAVLGDGADVPTVAAASSAEPDAALAALDTAARFGLMDGEELRTGRVAFPHMLTRQAVLELVTPSRLAQLHARAGEVLAAAGADSPRVVIQLANHFTSASALGYGDRAARYLAMAARAAERTLAFEDAAASCVRAAELLDCPEPERDELRLAAARNYVRAGDFASARTIYLQLSGSRYPRTRLLAAVGYEDAGWRPGLPGAEARALLADVLGDLPADHADAEYVRALASLGRAMAFTGEADQARAAGEEALASARALGDERLLIHALQTMLWHAFAPASIDDQLAITIELTSLARANGDWEALGIAAVFRAGIAYRHVDPAAWVDATADLDTAVRRSGQPFLAYMHGCGEYARAFLRADFAAAEKTAEDLLELGRSFGTDDTEGPYGLQMFMVRRETCALEAARPFVQAPPAEGIWEPGLLALYVELRLMDAARGLLHRLLATLDAATNQQSPWAQWTAVLAFLAEAAIALRDQEAAAQIRSLLTPFTGLQLVSGHFVAVFGPADAYLAALDSILEQHTSAEQLFERAISQNRALGSVTHQASTLAAFAASLEARGYPERAREVRAESRRLAESAGLPRVLRMTEGGAGHPAGLSPRELDVLRLLTRGSSNRDIARSLKITENTAANHVRSILIKTGAANRTQVATMALSGQLDSLRAPKRATAEPS